jgi:FKBP12-rapamycin complex-associated protein
MQMFCFLQSLTDPSIEKLLQILEKLLVAAVADSDVGVRKAVFVSLQQNRSFEEFLAQADSLRGIFIALSDEVGDDIYLCISLSLSLVLNNGGLTSLD